MLRCGGNGRLIWQLLSHRLSQGVRAAFLPQVTVPEEHRSSQQSCEEGHSVPCTCDNPELGPHQWWSKHPPMDSAHRTLHLVEASGRFLEKELWGQVEQALRVLVTVQKSCTNLHSCRSMSFGSFV
uniref:Uncharacterized protein n=1 Tax=Rangifer tarandus platyrhynchus TaxID=3082113 RepID=A0ACB0EM66_RANTA|nr:unnamed protein product [Rangifer tarandus platyrhynchus]